MILLNDHAEPVLCRSKARLGRFELKLLISMDESAFPIEPALRLRKWCANWPPRGHERQCIQVKTWPQVKKRSLAVLNKPFANVDFGQMRTERCGEEFARDTLFPDILFYSYAPHSSKPMLIWRTRTNDPGAF